jgi:apolipoprotein N-acyltransferase
VLSQDRAAALGTEPIFSVVRSTLGRLRRRMPLAALLTVLTPLALYVPLAVERAWPLAALMLVPWILLVHLKKRGVSVLGYVALLAAYLPLHAAVGRIAWIYQPVIALDFAPALIGTAWLVRAVSRRSPLPLALLVPPLWTAGELVRTNAVVPGWHRLAMALHAQPWAIQVCDFGGISACSAALCTTSAAVAGVLLRYVARDARPRHASVRAEVGVAFSVWGFVALYGAYRLAEAHATVVAGPRVMVVQTDDFPDDAKDLSARERLGALAELTRNGLDKTEARERPELIVWPESVLAGGIDTTFLAATPNLDMATALLTPADRSGSDAGDVATIAREQAEGRSQWSALRQMVNVYDTPLVVGGRTVAHEGADWQRFNSAFLVEPGATAPRMRHDKTVMFPLYESLPFEVGARRLPDAVRSALLAVRARQPKWAPLLAAGVGAKVFETKQLRFGVQICFESEFPEFEFSPAMRDTDRPRFWVQIANDWWGERSDAALRSFRFSVFRAVEARVGIARSSNASVAGFIAPTGELYDVVGGARAAQMPAPGRPELPAVHELAARLAERDALDHEAEFAPDASKRTQLAERRRGLVATIEQLRAQVRKGAALAATIGTSVARVRIDSRNSIYVNMRGASDAVLTWGWWGAIVLLAATRVRVYFASMRRRQPS